MAYEYVKQAYGVNPEIVERKHYTNYVYVRFDGDTFAKPCHPTALDYSQESPNDQR